jgi:opacity protein-like surface antigen
MRRLESALALGLLLLASTAWAQDRRVFVQVAGGMTLPLSGVREQFGAGWNLGMGFLRPVSTALSVRLDFLHARVADRRTMLDTSDTTIRAAQVAVTASHFMDAGTASVVFTPPRQPRRFKAYAIGGAGVYYRKVTLTSDGGGLVPVCNPWWFVCNDRAVTIDRIVGRRNSVGVGVSVGAGIAFAMTNEVTAYIEARFHHILGGPAYAVPGGGSKQATGEYLPISIGVRF